MKRINALDWLRALAVTAVVIGHARPEWAPGGAVGVSIFFVLSGHLICSMLLRDGMLTASNILKFILRRLGRIYPMYVLQIAAVSALLLTSDYPKWQAFLPWIPDMLTFARPPQEWFGYSIGVLWTLFVEFWFYVSFPLVMAAIGAVPIKMTANRKLLAGFAVVGAAAFITSSLFNTGGAILYYDHFLVGAAAAVIARDEALARHFEKPGLMLFGLLIILITIMVPYPGDRNLAWHIQSLVAGIGTFLVIIATMARQPAYRLELVAVLGRISFSIYLVHALLLDLMNPVVYESSSALAFYLVAVVAISAATYRYVEKPANAFVQRHVRFAHPATLAPAE